MSIPRPWWEGLGEGVNCYKNKNRDFPTCMRLLIYKISCFFNRNHILSTICSHKLGCLRQRLLSSPLERGDKGVCRFAATHPHPLFLEGNHKGLKFLNIKLGWVLKDKNPTAPRLHEDKFYFLPTPSTSSQEGTSQIPLLRGVGVCLFIA